MHCGLWAVGKTAIQSHAGRLMAQLLESLKPVIASGPVQKSMDNARHLKTESELCMLPTSCHICQASLGGRSSWKPPSKPIIEIQPRRAWTMFSKGADNLTSWLPAFIFSVVTGDKLSYKVGNLSWLRVRILKSCCEGALLGKSLVWGLVGIAVWEFSCRLQCDWPCCGVRSF